MKEQSCSPFRTKLILGFALGVALGCLSGPSTATASNRGSQSDFRASAVLGSSGFSQIGFFFGRPTYYRAPLRHSPPPHYHHAGCGHGYHQAAPHYAPRPALPYGWPNQGWHRQLPQFSNGSWSYGPSGHGGHNNHGSHGNHGNHNSHGGHHGHGNGHH